MNRGDIVEFKQIGFASAVLGRLLKLFEQDWDGWGWHLAISWEQAWDGWYILEALVNGVEINYYPNKYLAKNTRQWKWLDNPPTREQQSKFLASHIMKKYDIAIYFWTSLAIIARHYFNHPIPKQFDNRFDCWELTAEAMAEWGKPIVSKYDTIIITDIIRAVKGKEYDRM